MAPFSIVEHFDVVKDISPSLVARSISCSVHWFEGKLYHLRLSGGGPNVEGEPTTLQIRAHPWLLRARLEDAVGGVFANYEPFRQRPFSFLALKAELVKDACEIAKIDPRILSGITVTPRYELSAKSMNRQTAMCALAYL